jgi:hypothetical protein
MSFKEMGWKGVKWIGLNENKDNQQVVFGN